MKRYGCNDLGEPYERDDGEYYFVTEADAELARLRKYVVHMPDCAIRHSPVERCTCGLDAALRSEPQESK